MFTRFVLMGCIALPAVAAAQTIPVPPVGGLSQSQSILFDDGSASTSWKVFYPTGPGDAFSVDIDEMASGMTVTGVALNTWQTTSTGPIGIKYVAICPDNLLDPLGHTPDLNAAVSLLGSLSGTVTITGNPSVAAGFCPGFVGYDLPDLTLGTGGYHAVTTCLTGDSGTWLCSDSSAPDRRSYFTANNYSSVATFLGNHDLMVRVIGQVSLTPGSGASAYLTVNNATGAIDVDQTAFLEATLWSACAIQPTLYIQGVQLPSYPFLQVPPVILATGYENGSPIADSKQGSVGDYLSDPSTGPCVPVGVQFAVFGFYLDHCDLKKNGKPKLKITNQVTVTVVPGAVSACNPCICFGQLDDGALDTTIWKVNNPAGSLDYFNVSFDAVDSAGASCVTSSVTSIQMASWDFCGTGSTTGPSWASVGLYDNSTVGTPGTLLVAATTLSMPVNAADFGYPATTYDFPDLYASTSSALAGATTIHAAARWPNGDTCIWMASDTDGTDDIGSLRDSCSVIPSTTSYFTSNGYSTSPVQFTAVNWMMKIDWN